MRKPKRARITRATTEATSSEQQNELIMNNSNYKVIHPENIKVGLEEIFGHQECKKELKSLLHFLKDPQKYYNFGVVPHTKYLIAGDYGIGKKTLVCAIAKEAELPVIIVEPTCFCNMEVLDAYLEALCKEVAQLLENYPNCVLMFKNVEYWLSMENENSIPSIERLKGFFKIFQEIIAFATLSQTIAIPHMFMDSEGFTKVIDLEVPDVNTRKEALTYFLNGTKLEEGLDIHKLALDTYQMSIRDIKTIVKETKLYALKNDSDTITYKHFSEVLAESEFGYKGSIPSEEERLVTARHEAGHVIAGYFSNPKNYKVAKVDITPRSFYAGITQSHIDEERNAYNREEIEARIVLYYGGMAAEEYYYNTTTTGCSNDIQIATQTAQNYFKVYGMSKEIGPVCLHPDIFSSPILDVESDKAIRAFLKKKYEETLDLILKHANTLEALTKVLLEKEVLYKEEIMAILTSE